MTVRADDAWVQKIAAIAASATVSCDVLIVPLLGQIETGQQSPDYQLGLHSVIIAASHASETAQ